MGAEDIASIVERLQLRPHPEGGFYRETWRSPLLVDPGPAMEGARNCCTSIYFLLTAGNFSAFHRIRQDELWNFHAGDPVELHILTPEGEHREVHIGPDLEAGQLPQYVVPAGHWFASRVLGRGAWSLVGCVVAPGFDFRDFELAEREKLAAAFPQHGALITTLTRLTPSAS